jgi:hypothetical protein
MEKQDKLRLRKDLQELKRKLYALTTMKDLTSDKLSHLVKAYKELFTLSSKIGDPYESQE